MMEDNEYSLTQTSSVAAERQQPTDQVGKPALAGMLIPPNKEVSLWGRCRGLEALLSIPLT